jgi:thiosulfate/3-mercaptopyruvate sulfurtransferase
MHRTLLGTALAMLAAIAPACAQDVLVTTDWVWRNLADEKVRLVEVSVDPGVYEKGHVRGAVGFKWYTDLCDRLRRDIVSPENFEKLCRGAGISADTAVVLYGDNNNWFACWGYWIFTIYGHPNVKVMNGGRTKWELERRPWDTTVPSHPAGNFRASPPNPAIRARMNDVLSIVEGKERGVLVDVRSPDEYAGKIIAPPGIQELAIRAGRVPGAKNVPWNQTVNQDGTFKPVSALRKLYADAGVDGTAKIVTYCRIGERSSHSWFVLKFLLGYDARNYDGSWTEYGNAVGVPIENEAGTIWSGK